jgi:hypothetical protein
MFSIDDVIKNQLNPNETQFDISNKEENEINLYKISEKEKEILNELSNQRIFNLYKINKLTDKEKNINLIKIDDINYELLYNLIKTIYEECENLKKIKEKKQNILNDTELNKSNSFNSYSDILSQNEHLIQENNDLLKQIEKYSKTNSEILQRYSQDISILQNMLNLLDNKN